MQYSVSKLVHYSELHKNSKILVKILMFPVRCFLFFSISIHPLTKYNTFCFKNIIIWVACLLWVIHLTESRWPNKFDKTMTTTNLNKWIWPKLKSTNLYTPLYEKGIKEPQNKTMETTLFIKYLLRYPSGSWPAF